MRVLALVAVVAVLVTACAARPKSAEAPAATATSPAEASKSEAEQAGSIAADKPGAPPPPPAPAQPAAAPSPGFAAPPNRSVALTQAANDVAAAQRELDVAAGDCENACRALGSMDRAAGRLCGLAQSPDDQRRCGDAKGRVYRARDKVRSTCGRCADVTVDHDAPIPSR